jgi:hypothetical protein
MSPKSTRGLFRVLHWCHMKQTPEITRLESARYLEGSLHDPSMLTKWKVRQRLAVKVTNSAPPRMRSYNVAVLSRVPPLSLLNPGSFMGVPRSFQNARVKLNKARRTGITRALLGCQGFTKFAKAAGCDVSRLTSAIQNVPHKGRRDVHHQVGQPKLQSLPQFPTMPVWRCRPNLDAIRLISTKDDQLTIPDDGDQHPHGT